MLNYTHTVYEFVLLPDVISMFCAPTLYVNNALEKIPPDGPPNKIDNDYADMDEDTP